MPNKYSIFSELFKAGRSFFHKTSQGTTKQALKVEEKVESILTQRLYPETMGTLRKGLSIQATAAKTHIADLGIMKGLPYAMGIGSFAFSDEDDSLGKRLGGAAIMFGAGVMLRHGTRLGGHKMYDSLLERQASIGRQSVEHLRRVASKSSPSFGGSAIYDTTAEASVQRLLSPKISRGGAGKKIVTETKNQATTTLLPKPILLQAPLQKEMQRDASILENITQQVLRGKGTIAEQYNIGTTQIYKQRKAINRIYNLYGADKLPESTTKTLLELDEFMFTTAKTYGVGGSVPGGAMKLRSISRKREKNVLKQMTQDSANMPGVK